MLKSGYIAIIGRPNSGKSTLLNAILNTQISIVSPKAQTTRERIMGILTEKEGQIVFVDTPGIHRAREGGINEYMVNEAKEALEAPNLIWYLVDPFSSMEHENTVVELLEKTRQNPAVPVILLMNKVDCLRKKEHQENAEKLELGLREALASKNIPLQACLKISATQDKGFNEEGFQDLLSQSWGMMPEGPLYYPDPEQVSDRPTRFFVAEKIREQLFFCLGDEVPYSCAVEINKFQEESKPVRIEATIYVERDSQKGIVIGQGGKKIKEIGQAAREQIEDFLGQKIFLGLKVELIRNWTQNPKDLERMGYGKPSPGKKRKSRA